MKALVIIIISFIYMTITESLECPPAEKLRDCLCYFKSKTVRCINATELPLFSQSGSELNDFNLIIFENINLHSMDRYDLGTANFKKIVIENNPILQTLSADIFQNSPEVLIIRNNPVLLKDPLYAAVKNLRNTEIIQIENNDLITSVESGAFGNSPNLKQIFLKSNKIEEIATEAFQGLANLKEIRLDHNNITRLHKKSFDVSSTITFIEINLNSNYMLTADQLEGITSNDKTTINLYLENTNLISFPKAIFEPFLANNKNTLYLDGNHFQCLCDNNSAIWVLDENPYLSRQIIHLNCTNFGKEIFRLTRKEICPVETTTPSTIEPQPPTEQSIRTEVPPLPSEPQPPTEQPIRTEVPPLPSEPKPPTEQPIRTEVPPLPSEPLAPTEQPNRKEPEPDAPKEQPDRKEPEPDVPKEQPDRKEPEPDAPK